MGETTFIATNQAVETVKKQRGFRLRGDVPLFIITLIIIVIGLLMVFSASWNDVFRNGKSSVLISQLLYIGLGSIVAFTISLINYHFWRKVAVWMMLLVLIMLIVTLLIKPDNPGESTRSLYHGRILPSEFAKPIIIIYLSVWLASKREHINKITIGLIPLIFILGTTAFLIIAQPDLNQAIMITLIGCILFFLAGVNMRQIILIIILAAAFGTLLLLITGKWTKIEDFFTGTGNIELANDHIKRSFEAIYRGGLWGVGIGNSTTKFTGLPFPWTDSIFAVIVEETGIAGSIITLGLYLAFLWRGLTLASHTPDLLGKLLTAGMALWISLEALANLSVMTGVIPFAGNALPMMSAGGSSMISILFGIGILMSVAGFRNENPVSTDGRLFNAAVDLRWRDRRRRVSRSVSSSRTRR